MNDSRKIPDCTRSRLLLYHRVLNEYSSREVLSSEELAGYSDVTAAQLRKDLTCFGQFGKPGIGYNVNELRSHLLNILGMNRIWNIALIGVGSLGSAFLHCQDLRHHGFNIINAFDSDSSKIGTTIGGVMIQNISEFKESVSVMEIHMAMVMVAMKSARAVVDLIVNTGIRAILNFTTIRPVVPESVQVVNIDLLTGLEKLAFSLTQHKQESPFFCDSL